MEQSVADPVKIIESGGMKINAAFSDLLAKNSIDDIEKLFSLQGETVKKAVKQRGTERVYLTGLDDQPLECYIKRCTAIPFSEKIKCFFQLKRWNFDSLNEWHALLRFHELGLNTMQPIAAGYLNDGSNCLLTLGLTGCIRATDFFSDAKYGHEEREKAINNIAMATAKMHNGGMAHQDLYMVHFFIKPEEDFAAYIIDLQRIIFGTPVKSRWHIKDIGQLEFAAGKILNKNEMKTLFDTYRANCNISRAREDSFIKAVAIKAAKITRHDDARAKRREAAAIK